MTPEQAAVTVWAIGAIALIILGILAQLGWLPQ